MFNRISALCLMGGLLAGYALAGTSVEAQNPAVSPVPPFVNQGDTVTLVFERGAYGEYMNAVQCNVRAMMGTWIRCAPDDKFSVQQEQKWYSLQRVIEITKKER